MDKLETLVNEIAWLSNDSVAKLARILVHNYPTRADVVEAQISAAFQESQLDFTKEFVHE